MSESIKLLITGMTCNGHVESVDESLNAVAGVDFAVISQDDNMAVIIGTASAQELIAAVESAGCKAVKV